MTQAEYIAYLIARLEDMHDDYEYYKWIEGVQMTQEEFNQLIKEKR